MRVDELFPGDVFHLPGLPGELELLRITDSSATVRPLHPWVRVFTTHAGDNIRFVAHPHAVRISRGTLVEVAS